MVPFRKYLIFSNQGKPAIKGGGHFYTTVLDILMFCRGHTAPTNLPLWMGTGPVLVHLLYRVFFKAELFIVHRILICLVVSWDSELHYLSGKGLCKIITTAPSGFPDIALQC